MNCPHGKGPGQECAERACVQRVFEPKGGGPVLVVSLLYCETCDEQIGCMPKTRGLAARWIRLFQAKHARCALLNEQIGWEAIEVDTQRPLWGAGPTPLLVDSDEKNVSLMITDS